jgi:hypothetical protein
MYGFEFNIAGNAAKQMQDMFKSVNDLRASTKAMQSQFDVVKMPPLSIPTKNPFRDIMPSANKENIMGKMNQHLTTLNTGPIMKNQATGQSPIVAQKVATPNIAQTIIDAQKPIVTLRERMGTISTAALDIQRGFEYMQMPLQNAPERWGVIRQSIVDTMVAAHSGDFTTMFASITSGFDETLGFINDFRTTWDFAKAGFQGAKTIFGETFKVFSENAMQGINMARTMGVTFLTQTLPSVLKFVGQGVVSMGGYIASLMGATGAQTALNVVMAANPIGLIVTGIVAVGLAVYGLITYWENIKQYMFQFGQFFIQNHPFRWVLDIVDKVFPNLKTAVYETFGKIYEFIDKYFIQPIKFAFGWLIDQAKGITSDVNAAIMQTVTPSVSVTPVIDTKAMDSMKLSTPIMKMPKHEPIGVDKKTKEITGEQKQVKYITININSLISGGFSVVSNNLQESEQKIKDVITRVLVDATNQVNYQ